MAESQWTFEKVEELYKRFNPMAIDGEGRKVVVAEDSTPMRAVICSSLEKYGFEAIPAENGLIALQKIRKERPACCLLDINMPKMSGLSVLEAVRKDPAIADTAVLICTARKERREILQATQLGASGYIVKPFQMDDLLQRVAKTVEEAS